MFVSFRSWVNKGWPCRLLAEEQFKAFTDKYLMRFSTPKPASGHVWYDEFAYAPMPYSSYPVTKTVATFTAKTHRPKISSKVEVK